MKISSGNRIWIAILILFILLVIFLSCTNRSTGQPFNPDTLTTSRMPEDNILKYRRNVSKAYSVNDREYGDVIWISRHRGRIKLTCPGRDSSFAFAIEDVVFASDDDRMADMITCIQMIQHMMDNESLLGEGRRFRQLLRGNFRRENN